MSYVYCVRGGPPDKSVILYDYNDVQHKQFVHDWFVGFNGYLHVDGDNFFDLVGSDNASIVNCNAHARRKFEPIAQANKGKGIAKEAMRVFKELYKIEREAKNNQYYVMLLKNLPHCRSVDDYEKLLPWNIGLDYTPKF